MKDTHSSNQGHACSSKSQVYVTLYSFKNGRRRTTVLLTLLILLSVVTLITCVRKYMSCSRIETSSLVTLGEVLPKGWPMKKRKARTLLLYNSGVKFPYHRPTFIFFLHSRTFCTVGYHTSSTAAAAAASLPVFENATLCAPQGFPGVCGGPDEIWLDRRASAVGLVAGVL